MEALVTAAKNGDKEAFVQLIRINKQNTFAPRIASAGKWRQ